MRAGLHLRLPSLAAVALLASCVSVAVPDPVPDPGLFDPTRIDFGAQAARIRQFCEIEATRECPSATIACDAYRGSFIEACMQVRNVPPEYILLAR